jgi:protein tyrosine/serine phosphatase
VKNIEPGEKSEPYKMNIEKMRVSSNYDSGDGIEIESKSIDSAAVIHNSKELAKKAQTFAGNLLAEGKNAAIVAAGNTAKKIDAELSDKLEDWFEIKSNYWRMFALDMLNSLGPLMIIYAILPLTI